jgi:lactobin A/cerein 7B family class IIb bacteriocin
MNLQSLNVQEMNSEEMQVLDGGIIPVIVLVGWAAMGGCCAITGGLWYGYNNN